MKSHFYREKYAGIQRTFELLGPKLLIDRKGGPRMEVNLMEVRSVSEKSFSRNLPALRRSRFCLGVVLLVAVLCWTKLSVPTYLVVLCALLLSLPAIHVIAKFAHPIERELFLKNDGQIAFDVLLVPSINPERDDFLRYLRESLAASKPA